MLMGAKKDTRYLALMQPYLFPYIGYFSLIAQADIFVFFDSAQYIKKGWINRNKIAAKSEKGWTYMNAPVRRHSHDTLIKDIEIAEEHWRRKILNVVTHYKTFAPFYSETRALLEELLSSPSKKLADFNIGSIITLCDYLGLSSEFKVASHMDVPVIGAAGDHALAFCQQLNVPNYVNPPGAVNVIFDLEKFAAAEVALYGLHNNYHWPICGNSPPLSVIDELFRYGRDEVRSRILNFEMDRKV